MKTNAIARTSDSPPSGIQGMPCAGQTPEQILAHYNAVRPGDPAVVRHGAGDAATYVLTTVRTTIHRFNRIRLEGYGSFTTTVCRSSYNPSEPVVLVVPTPETLAAAKAPGTASVIGAARRRKA